MLELRNVSKTYGDFTALHPLSMEVPPGRTTALLGPSGCGKSTLLRIIVGLIRPDDGQVLMHGQLVTSDNIRQCRHRMGYMIQDGGLFPHLTVAENVTLLAGRLGWPQPRMEARLDELIELTHLRSELLARYPRQISGGQQQRVSLMRALFLDPDVMLLDEPMGALDPLIRSELQHELRGIFSRLNKTVVLVTHDIGEAGFVADEISLLRAGRLVQRGTLEELVRQPADPFVSKFIQAQRSPLDSL